MGIVDTVVDLAVNPYHTQWLAPLLILADTGLTFLIIQKIPYTEIDWTTYMQQVSLYLSGERDYAKITGSTGPLVYPAAHLYIYRTLYWLTDNGTSVRAAQYCFMALYLVTLTVVLSCYRKCGAPPWLLPLLVASKRLHSIFVLRLFNDGIAVLCLWLAIWCWQRRVWTPGVLVFSFGVGVKMSLLLALPAVGLVLWQAMGRGRALRMAGLMVQLQILLGFPFLTVAPISYLTRAFEFSRVFLFKWTVNWRFVGQNVFLSKPFSNGLLLAHANLLALFAATRWLDPSDLTVYEALQVLLTFQEAKPAEPTPTNPEEPKPSGQPKPKAPVRSEAEMKMSRRVTPAFVTSAVLQSMLIGCVCARSLHYQFYAYIAWSTPFLMWRSGLGPVPTYLLWAAQEWAWNVYPSTDASSVTVVACLAATIAASWYGTGGVTRNLNIDSGSSKKTA